MATPMDHALTLAACGVPVFPCNRETKRPLTRHGFKDASLDPAQITGWWRVTPDALVGYATGAPSGVFVLDIDLDPSEGKNGYRALELAGHRICLDPPSYYTRRGGAHVLFRHFPGFVCRQDILAAYFPGLDTRGDGGYAIYWPAAQDPCPATVPILVSALPPIPPWVEPKAVRPVRQGPPPEIDPDTVDIPALREALTYLDPDCSRDLWIKVLMGLNTFGAEDLAREWSSGEMHGRSAEKFDDSTFDYQWGSLKPDGAVRLESVFFEAKKCGWHSPLESFIRMKRAVPPPSPPPAPAAPVPPAATEAPAPEAEPYSPPALSGMVLMHEIPEIFAGWVYLRESNAAVSPEGKVFRPSAFQVLFGGCRWQTSSRGKAKEDAWVAFTQAESFRPPQVDRVCIEPLKPYGEMTRSGDDVVLNIWRGISTRRIEGDASMFLDLIGRILPDPHDQGIILAYASAVVQYPGVKFQWWPVMQGAEGNGKSLIASCVAQAVGLRYCQFPNVAEIARNGLKFNAWIRGSLFLSFEEVYVPKRREFLEEMKTVVTNRVINVERKGVDAGQEPNYANGMMFTNHLDGVPISLDTRRYCVLYTAQQSFEDIEEAGMGGEYFPRVYRWLRGEAEYGFGGEGYGFAIVANFLQRYPIPDAFNPATTCMRAPKSSTHIKALSESLGPVEQEILEMVAQEQPGFAGGWISSIKLRAELDRAGMRMPGAKLPAALKSIGYAPHPALPDGRCTRVVLPDGGKPRLFIRHDSPDRAIADPELAMAAYSAAQGMGRGK